MGRTSLVKIFLGGRIFLHAIYPLDSSWKDSEHARFKILDDLHPTCGVELSNGVFLPQDSAKLFMMVVVHVRPSTSTRYISLPDAKRRAIPLLHRALGENRLHCAPS